MSYALTRSFGIQKWIQTLADYDGLVVVYEETKKPRTDGTHIYVQQPSPNWNEEQLTEWTYTVLHEMGHNTPAQRKDFAIYEREKWVGGSFTHVGYNIIQDYTNEYEQIGRYPGVDKYLRRGRKIWTEAAIEPSFEAWAAKRDDSSTDDEQILRDGMLALSAWDTAMREMWNSEIAGASDRMISHMSGRWLGFFEKLIDGDYTEVLHEVIDDPEGKLDLWNRIQREVFEIDTDKQKQADSIRAAAGDSENGSEEGARNTGSSTGTDGADNARKAEGEAPRKITVRYDDIVQHKHGHDEDEYAFGTDQHIEYSSANYDEDAEYKPAAPDDLEIVEYWREPKPGENAKEFLHIASKLDDGSSIAKKVRRILQVRSQTLWQHGTKKGKIDAGKITRALMRGSGDYQRRFRKKKIETLDLKGRAVTILIDTSGSMSGNKYAHAMRAGVLLHDAIESIGVPVEILGFTTSYSKKEAVICNIYKPFGKRLDKETLLRSIACGADRMAANADGDSILWAYRRLKSHGAPRQTLIVLSDGSPACGRGNGVVGFTRKVIRAIEADRVCDIYGVGIQDDNVEKLYSHSIVIEQPNELEAKILNLVRKSILGE